MEYAIIASQQVLVMALLICVGFLAGRRKWIDQTGSKQITNLLMYVVMLALKATSFQIERTHDRVIGLFVSLGLAVLFYALSIAVVTLVIRKRNDDKYGVERFAVVFANVGYMAYPILTAVLGKEGIFYGSGLVIVYNLLSWTYGPVVLSGNPKSMNLRKAILNPGMLSTVVPFILFFGQIRLPAIVNDALTQLGNLNTPLAMLVIGVLLSKVNFKEMFTDKHVYFACFLRLIVVPLLTIGVFRLCYLLDFPNALPITVAAIIGVCTPCGANSGLMPLLFGGDAAHGSNLVAFSSILSIVTMPLMIILGTWGLQ